MFRFLSKNKAKAVASNQAPKTTVTAIESLESRRLLSAAVATVQYDSKILSSSLSSNIQGYTPSEIRQAYGFDSVAFSTGSSTTANGAGQTIAIIDAYNDPNIVSDLGVFDSQFGLSGPPSFKVVNETGGSTLPATDAGWAGEISLDVEWAHAIATGANILLVEAGSDNTDDLMTAVNYARHADGVSVVSMSWGGPEFSAGFGTGTSQSQTSYDSYFTTPAGHQGITFVAASGDGGSQGGVEWPASSPNVLSVGGTTLTTSATGAYSSESSWADSTGGYSTIESEPAYQKAVQSAGMRSTPDVAYNASTSAGFAVYDSVPDQGYVGWQAVDGTSAGVAAMGRRSSPLPIRAAHWPARHRWMAPRKRSRCCTLSTALPGQPDMPATRRPSTTSSTRPAAAGMGASAASAAMAAIPGAVDSAAVAAGPTLPQPLDTTPSPAWARPKPPESSMR